jgi:hypothetical protein
MKPMKSPPGMSLVATDSMKALHDMVHNEVDVLRRHDTSTASSNHLTGSVCFTSRFPFDNTVAGLSEQLGGTEPDVFQSLPNEAECEVILQMEETLDKCEELVHQLIVIVGCLSDRIAGLKQPARQVTSKQDHVDC